MFLLEIWQIIGTSQVAEITNTAAIIIAVILALRETKDNTCTQQPNTVPEAILPDNNSSLKKIMTVIIR